MSKVGTGCFSPVLKSCLPRKPSHKLSKEPFLAQLVKSNLTPACLARGMPGMLTGARENEPWLLTVLLMSAPRLPTLALSLWLRIMPGPDP